MLASELRNKEVKELKQVLVELRKEQFNLRIQLATGENANTSQKGKLRKNIARVLTVINEKNK